MLISEACRMAVACGASVLLASALLLIRRLASAHICYVAARVRHLEVLTEAAARNIEPRMSDIGSALRSSELSGNEALTGDIDSQSIIKFYSGFGRHLNATELESITQFERYRQDYSLEMSNLKVFPYVLGEYTDKPLPYLLVANDLKDCREDNMIFKEKSTNRIRKKEDGSV